MVMENLLFGRNILRRYDLKGALFSRYVADSKNPEAVLLDQNFIEDMRAMPIYIEGKTKNLMGRSMRCYAAFGGEAKTVSAKPARFHGSPCAHRNSLVVWAFETWNCSTWPC